MIELNEEKAAKILKEINEEVTKELGKDDGDFMFLILLMILLLPRQENPNKDEFCNEISRIYDIIIRNNDIKEIFCKSSQANA